MQKIAVFGGSFDPVHNAHMQMALCAVEEFAVDKVIFVPAYKPPHKVKLVAEDKARYDMLNLCVEKYKNFVIDTYETDLKKEVFSYQMLDYMRCKYKDCDIKMLIGSDSFNQLNSWKKTDYICKNYGFYVVRRPDAEADKNSPYYDFCVFSKKIMPLISSTEIRKKIEKKEDISIYVPKEVEDYIKEKKLYMVNVE